MNSTLAVDSSGSPPFTPPGGACGVEAVVKSTPTVLWKKDSGSTQMEVDQPLSSSSGRPPVPQAKPAKASVPNMPVIIDEAGMKQLAHTMLSGHPGGQVMDFEQWGTSFTTQFKSVIDTMSQSLRIKEEDCNQMFFDKCNAIELVTKNREMVSKAQAIIDEAEGKTSRSC